MYQVTSWLRFRKGKRRNQENNRQRGALQSSYVFHSVIMQTTQTIQHYQLNRFHRIVSVLIRYLVCLLSYGNRPTPSAQRRYNKPLPSPAFSCLLLPPPAVCYFKPTQQLFGSPNSCFISPLPHCFSPAATTAGLLISHFVEFPGVRTYFWGQTHEAATPSHRQKNSGREFDPLPGHRRHSW